MGRIEYDFQVRVTVQVGEGWSSQGSIPICRTEHGRQRRFLKRAAQVIQDMQLSGLTRAFLGP
jgi:hypothetical protein